DSKGSAAEQVHGARRIAWIPSFRDQDQRDRRLPAGDHNQPASYGREFELRKRHPVRTAAALASGHRRISTRPGRGPEFRVRLSGVVARTGRCRGAARLLTAAEQKCPKSALGPARRSRVQSAMKLGEADLVASVGQTGAPQPDEGSGKKSKKGKATKKSKNK